MREKPDRAFPDNMDSWPEEKLRRYQLRKIRRVLRDAYENLPFYRQRFDEAKIRPDAVKNFSDLTWVPSFTKREVLEAVTKKKSFHTGMEKMESPEKGVLCMTSGTLGTSFLYLPPRWASIRGDSLVRAYWWAGLRPGMRMLMAAPAWHSLAVQETRVLHRLGATCVIPWGTFLPRHAGNFLAAIRDVKPDFLSMFLPMLYALLAECRRRKIPPAEAFRTVRYILVVGAPMTPLSREKLKVELGVNDIFEGLGNPEGLTAMECSFHGGHHIFLDCCYVEVIDPKSGTPLPPGKRGSVVITSLIPYGTVYIRYDTEDLGEILPGPCPCGKTWPLLEVYDRLANTIGVAGKEIVPYDVRLCMDEVPALTLVPFAVVRGRGPMDVLKLMVQKPQSGDLAPLESHLKAAVKNRLGIATAVAWTEELPERWKGATVIDEDNGGMPHV